MTLFSRFGLLAVMVVSSTACLSDTADAKWLPIFKCRQKCCEEVEPAPEPAPEVACCPAPAPEPEPMCCPAPEPAPVCCAAAEPAPEPEPVPATVCCAPAPEPEPAPEPAAEPADCCCCCCCDSAATETAVADAIPTSDTAAAIEQFGMPELAEGETLVSISPIEMPTEEEAATLTVGEKE